jgi:hypothetical protein
VSLALFMRHWHRDIQAGDGILVVSSSAFDGKSIEAGRTWLAEIGQDVWIVGPLENAPPAATEPVPGAETPQHAEEDAEILGFLDDMKQKHGERSVIFVRPLRRRVSHSTNAVVDRVRVDVLPEEHREVGGVP